MTLINVDNAVVELVHKGRREFIGIVFDKSKFEQVKFVMKSCPWSQIDHFTILTVLFSRGLKYLFTFIKVIFIEGVML